MATRKRKYNRQRCMAIICKYIATSDKSLHDICEGKKYLPAASTVIYWVGEGGSLSEQYARARERQADYLAFDIVRISRGEENPLKAKNMIEANKWISSKLHPKKYGDKIELNGSLDVAVERDPVALETALALSAIFQAIKARMPAPVGQIEGKNDDIII